ncbi:MAG TPA: VOC family protein [Aggregatilineaceae bacterium]|nr:VOC family protein [Aggregatilineaceae bacterium]
MMNAVTWFEIPAEDFERAVKFYETLLQISMRCEVINGEPNAFFPFDEAEKAVGGVVTKVPHAKPGSQGSIVYLNAHSVPIFDQALAQVEQLGGSVVIPKTDLGPIGYVAVITDCEGNRVGLSTSKPE